MSRKPKAIRERLRSLLLTAYGLGLTALFSACALKRQAPPPPPEPGEVLRTWERDAKAGVGRVIWARNDTTVALTVTALTLFDCGPVTPPCGAMQPNVTVQSGQTVELLTIRPTEGDVVKYKFAVEYKWTESGNAPEIRRSEFIYEVAPFPSAHASTIAETRDGLIAAWFGGTREGAPDVGIWSSRYVNGGWTQPVEIANGRQSDGGSFACYNPVLFETRDGVLHLFYKVGPQPALWWGMTQTSRDGGRTWSAARRLPGGILGPVRNKPVQLASGRIVSPSSTESPDATSVWRVHFELSDDNGLAWSKVVPNSGADINAIQPAILQHAGGRLQAVGRTRSGRVFETWSSDEGATWSPVALLDVPNPNAGIDAITLSDRRQLLVYNNTPQGRTPLNVALSRDGKGWTPTLVLEDTPGEYSYPAVIQTRDGLVHVTYTWRRQRIRHVVIDPGR